MKHSSVHLFLFYAFDMGVAETRSGTRSGERNGKRNGTKNENVLFSLSLKNLKINNILCIIF